jgi:hypothetical protein
MIVNSRTSILPIETQTLNGGSTIIVYLSTTTETGQTVTIRDIHGFLSSPQSITISTTESVTLAGGTLILHQRYGYVTLRSASHNSWSIIDQTAISDPQIPYSLRALTGSNFEAGNANITTLSTNRITGSTLTLQSTLQGPAPLYVSSLTVAQGTTTAILQIGDSLSNLGNFNVAGGISTVGRASIFSTINQNGKISTYGNVTIQGGFIHSTSGIFRIQGAISTGYVTTFQSATSTGGFTQIQTSLRITEALQTSTFQTNALVATNLTANNLQLSTSAFHHIRPDISITAPGYTGISTPVVEIQQGLAGTTSVLDWITTYTLRTQNIAIGNSISSPNLINIVLSNATIQNPYGSLVTSSIQTNTLSYTTLFGPVGPQLTRVIAPNLTTSTMAIQYELLLLGQVQFPTVVSDTVSSVNTFTSSLNLGGVELRANTLTLSTIFISSGIESSQLSSIIITNAVFNNFGGRFTTRAAVASTVNTSSLSIINQINSGNSFNFSTTSVNISTAVTSTISSYTILTSSLYNVGTTIGAQLLYSTLSPGGLYLFPSTASGLSSNTPYEYVSGLGVTYNPIIIKASVDRTVNLFLGNISSFSTAYITAQMNFRNDGSSSGRAGLRVGNYGANSTIISFNASPILPIQTITLSNYPVERNFDMIGFTYRLSGPVTSYPITNISPQIIIGAGNALIYSYDSGVTWATVNTTIFDTEATGVAWNGTMWVATGVGSVNTLAYSYDGITWYGSGKTIFTFYGNCVAWNGNVWVAGGAGINTFAYSYDGITWFGLGSSVIGTETTSIAWNGYMFIAVGRNDNTMAYSYDGISWSGLGHVTFTYGHGVAWGGRWVAVGEGNTLAYSTDGFVWVNVTVFTTKGSSIGWNGSQWVAGGQGTYQIAYSSDGISWTGVAIPSIMTNAIGVSWSGTYWIVLGSNGAVAKSTDGVNWTPILTNPLTIGRGVASRTTLPTTNTGDFLYTSTDSFTLAYSLGGSVWNGVTSLISGTANTIIWNGRIWLAAIQNGGDSFAYSSDGILWVGLGSLIFSGGAFQIAWNGYIWVATGSGANTLGYSYDGVSWTGLGTTVFTTGYGIAWGKDRFVATGEGANTLAYSYTGLTWTSITNSFFTSGRKLAYNSSTQWVACGIGASPIIYSADGLSWAAGTQPFDIQGWDVAWGLDKWVAVGASTSGVNAAYSLNGTSWTPLTLSISGKGIAWTGTSWYITGSASNPIVYTSTNGITWTIPSPTPNFTGAAYTLMSKQCFPYERLTIACASSTSGLMAISPDGRFWSPISTPFTQHARGVAWNGSQWVAGGAGTYQIAYSSDGVNWTGVTLANMTSVYSIAWGVSTDGTVQKWIAIGEGTHTRAESTNGITWTSFAPTITGFFTTGGYAIIAARGGWIALGGTNMGGLATTTNGTTWTATSPALFTTGRGIVWNGRDYVAVGLGTNTLAYSMNGTSWLSLPVFSVEGNGVAYGAGVWVAVGEGTNTIAFSTNGYEWTGLGATIFTERGKAITWNGTYFAAAGQGTNTLAYSDDGIHWIGQATTFSTATYLGNSGRVNGIASRVSRPPLTIREGVTFNWASAGWAAAITPSMVMKSPSAAAAWDSRVNSVEGYTESVYFTFRPSAITNVFMIGLSENPSLTTSYTQINYAFSCDATAALIIYELGFIAGSFGTYSIGDTLKITFDSGTIRYYKNGTLLRSVTRASVNPLYLSCSINTPGAKVSDIDFHPMYRIVSSNPTISTTSYVAATTPFQTSISPPFYLTLTNDVSPSLWTFNLTVGSTGLLSNYSTNFSADIYLNETKYCSTNTISNVYVSSAQTYLLNFSVPTTIVYTPNTSLNVRFKSDRTVGDMYSYINWVNSNGTQGYSTVLNNIQPNPNAMEFLQFFHTNSNTGIQTSELAVWITPTSTNTTSYVDSNNVVEMNRSYIKWNSALNGITIQNRFNDIQTRSLTYTGALYFASDSNLKHSIEYVDQNSTAAIFDRIPLRRYRFSDAYRSTFQTEDTHQLGVLTSEIQPSFVTESPFEFCSMSTLHMVDGAQLRQLHLAATQNLMARVSSLKARIADKLHSAG